MNIIGGKVVLRAIDIGDADLLFKMINDPETEKMLGGRSFPVSLEEQKKWIEAQGGRKDVLRCIIADKECPEKGLGTVIISDIDYINATGCIHIKMDSSDSVKGKGYATDTFKSILNYAFNTLRLNCIYADVLEYNTASQKLLERCGFKKEGMLRQRAYKDGKFVDMISYSILAEELQ